ncbi:helix-turn-helix domain-containing protein [Streptomyces sp. MUM 203J]|uniref:helix-turn-helix domain-containing protein n=1 Tax=Streptomyces sp. MUM 203J TaxID=2791990 RepID=UPI001F0453CC|nr:helix-turn-helix transcriptional regulator [Streptomyces sp. MUM 203J]MCH0542239.1 helix-turn-helix domain-containing protein [Streptomyces sp. MUM 203J]
MSSDASPDPYEDSVRFGQRVHIFRNRGGMTREQLAGLLGHHPSWVKKVETGALRMPRLPEVLRIAEVLRVPRLNDLVGDVSEADVELFVGPGHQRLPAVAAAINAFPLDADAPAPCAEHLRARVARAWVARHSSPNHREVLGDLLPGLIRDAQVAARRAETAADRRAAQAVLAEVYSLAQFFLAYQPDPALLWRVAERAMVAAQESEDPHAIGVTAWLAAQAHRDSGPAHFDAADDVTGRTLRYLEPLLPDATVDVRAIAGALTFEAAYTAARRMETGTAWGWWDRAAQMAGRLPRGYAHPVTSFGAHIMGAHAVTVAVELRKGGESVRQAVRAEAGVIRSRPRRARHRIEQARAYYLDGQYETAVSTLEQAHEAAPETTRYNGYARRIVLEETASRTAERRQRAAALAVKIGMTTA